MKPGSAAWKPVDVALVSLLAVAAVSAVVAAVITSKAHAAITMTHPMPDPMSTQITDNQSMIHTVATDYAEAKDAGVADDAAAWTSYHLAKVVAYRAGLKELGLLD